MKFFLIVSMLVAPIFGYSVGRVAFDQDTMGNYNLHYDTDEASRIEKRLEDGSVEGSYYYFDTDGMKHTLHYSAGANEGFHVIGDSIPKPVPETKELIDTRAQHLAFFKEFTFLHPSKSKTVVYKTIPEPSVDPNHVAYLIDGKHSQHYDHEHGYTFTSPEYHTFSLYPYQQVLTHFTLPSSVEYKPTTAVHAETYPIFDKEHLLAQAEHLDSLAEEYGRKQ